MELKVRTIGYMETWDGIFKRSMRNNNKKILSLLSIVLGLRGVYGLPEGTEPISGVGSFASEGNTMTITAPDGSVFSHGSFNVNSGETVQFVQPSVNARVLNRITSSSVSTINGTVEANGKLYFAAPGGLIFGEGSVIQARHLQAVAGAVNESNWDQSPQFSGTIENRGTINADSIVLGGETVSNRELCRRRMDQSYSLPAVAWRFLPRMVRGWFNYPIVCRPQNRWPETFTGMLCWRAVYLKLQMCR